MINKQSGLLFEKRLIEKHVQVSARPGYAPSFERFAAKLHAWKLVAGSMSRQQRQETGTDPITGEALSLDDLVAVKSNKVRWRAGRRGRDGANFLLAHLLTCLLELAAMCPRMLWLVQAVKPRTSPATSIPGLLGLFHNVRPRSAQRHRPGHSALASARALLRPLCLQDNHSLRSSTCAFKQAVEVSCRDLLLASCALPAHGAR